MAIINFHEVTKNYNGHEVLGNLSFTIEKNSFTTIMGPNGAGKTTVVRLALGLETPSKGKIEYAKHLKTGYVPQKMLLKPFFSLNVKSFINLMAPDYDPQHSLTDKILNFADFNNLIQFDIANLSGGQQQRLALAASLLCLPELLILDEPLQGLDLVSQHEFYELINIYKSLHSLTIMMISHDLYTVMKNSDQVICINRHICCKGRPDDLKNDQIFLTNFANVGLYTHHHDHRH